MSDIKRSNVIHVAFTERAKAIKNAHKKPSAFEDALEDARHAKGFALFEKANKLDEDKESLREAEAIYKQVIELLPDFYDAHVNLGVVLYLRGAWLAAKAAFVKAVEVSPESKMGHFNLGVIAFKEKDYKAAIQRFAKSVRIEPTFVDAHFWIGEVYESVHKRSLARNHWREAIRLGKEQGIDIREISERLLQHPEIQEMSSQPTATGLSPTLERALMHFSGESQYDHPRVRWFPLRATVSRLRELGLIKPLGLRYVLTTEGARVVNVIIAERRKL